MQKIPPYVKRPVYSIFLSYVQYISGTYLDVDGKYAVRPGGMFIQGMFSNNFVHLPLSAQ